MDGRSDSGCTHLEAVALDDLGQEAAQVELDLLAPVLGAHDQELGQVATHPRR